MAIPRLCSIPDCSKRAHGRDFCMMHYKRWLKHGDALAGRRLAGEAESYFREVVLTYEGEECLIWPFTRGSNGYAYFSHALDAPGIRSRSVARLLCAEVNGAPPTPSHQTAHSCGYGHLGCVTKRHIRWATCAENEADKLVHGTHCRSERHGRTKLTNDDVRRIRELKGRRTQAEIAEMFGVSRPTIGLIYSGKNWKYLS